VATLAGLIAVLFCWPILILTKAVKVPLKVRRNQVFLRPSAGGDAS
jgi:hypothetical protein